MPTLNDSDGIELSLAGTILNVSVDSSVVRTTRDITAGDGLSGGGDLSADRTLAVDSSVVRTSRDITAGDGLSGGGDLSADRTLAVDSTVVRTTGAQSIAGIKTFDDGIKLAATKGIDFSAYGSGADIDSNLLDDYEEGTWDPTYVLGGGTATVDGSTVGDYVKVGNAVHVTCRIATSSVSTPSGDLKIDGLPFTSKATRGLAGAAIGVAHSWAGNKLAMRAYIGDNDDQIGLLKNETDDGFISVVGGDLDTTAGTGKNLCVIQLTYFVD